MKCNYRLSVMILFIMVLTLSSAIVYADYPIFYQRYTADPSGLEYNGRLYLYCSHDVFDPNNVGYIMKDFTCISTDDLKNWTDHGEVFNVLNDCSWGARLSWAPSVVYRNNKFYMYYGNGSSNIGVAVSDNVLGPFKDTRSSALVTRSTPGVGEGAPDTYGMWCFDPGVFVDDDGQAYMYFGGGGVGNDRVIRLNSDMVSINGSAQTLNIPGFFEAAYIHKCDGTYYFTCASHYYSSPARIDYSTSSSPMSGFQIRGTVLQNPPNNVSNNNHASIFNYLGNWYIAYHNRDLAMQNGVTDGTALIYQRSVCLDRMYYNPDGTIQQVTITRDGLTQLKYVNPYDTIEAETMTQESGINTEACSEGGRNVNSISNGDWIRVRGVDFKNGATSFEARVASAASGGNIEIRLGSTTGTLAGTCSVSGTGGWQTWTTRSCTISGATGVHDLYFRFTGGSGNLFNFNWWKFYGGTESTPTPEPTPEQTQGPTPTPNQEPIFSGGPYALDGSSVYVDLPDGLTDNLYDLSIACWVNLNSLDTWTRVYDFGGDTNIFMMLTPASGNTGYPYFCITLTGNAGEQGLDGTSALPAGSWQHIAVTRSGNTGILYINTQEVDRNTGMTLNPADLGNTLNNYIGRSQWSHDPYLNGEVDEFLVYNRALSASEIAALGTSHGITPEPTPSPTPTPTGTLGDVNGDGIVDIVDALLIAQHYVGLDPVNFIPENADVNCDGLIDIVDALLVAQYYVGLIIEFTC